MRILLNLYFHYTQVVFPMLAQDYNWSVQFNFDKIISYQIGAYGRMNRQQLKKALVVCHSILLSPEKNCLV